MTAEEFKTAFEAEITVKYHGAWTLFAETKKGFIPVCFAVAFLMHPDPRIAPCMILDQLVWFPWATPRSRVEGAVNFFNQMRNEIPMLTFAREQTKKFVEVLMRHGVLRRIGTSHTVSEGEALGVYETRKS